MELNTLMVWEFAERKTRVRRRQITLRREEFVRRRFLMSALERQVVMEWRSSTARERRVHSICDVLWCKAAFGGKQET